MEIIVSEHTSLTLEQIKLLERVCRKHRKCLKANSGGSNKCNRTIDMFEQENLGER